MWRGSVDSLRCSFHCWNNRTLRACGRQVSPGRFTPNVDTRLFWEDIPYGLCILKNLAGECNFFVGCTCGVDVHGRLVPHFLDSRVEVLLVSWFGSFRHISVSYQLTSIYLNSFTFASLLLSLPCSVLDHSVVYRLILVRLGSSLCVQSCLVMFASHSSDVLALEYFF